MSQPLTAGTPVLVQFPKERVPGFVDSVHGSPDPREEFDRINVKLNDGRLIRGCHPDCVTAQ